LHDAARAQGVTFEREAVPEDRFVDANGMTFHYLDWGNPDAPDMLLLANVGAVQLNYGYGPEHCRRAVDMVAADALILHFNALQEAVQPEGDDNFAGLTRKIEAVCRALPVPVIAKEVGWGFSIQDARDLASAGVAAIDVAGAGGTSWSEVEYHRAPDRFHAGVAAAFADWGIPTASALRKVREGRRACPSSPAAGCGTASMSPSAWRSAPAWPAWPAPFSRPRTSRWKRLMSSFASS